MLMPKKVKHRKTQRGRLNGQARGGASVAFGDFGIDAFMVDAGGETKIEMLLDHLAGDVADILVADAGVVGPLRGRIAGRREAERAAVLVEEIFLFETEPGAGIVENGSALV